MKNSSAPPRAPKTAGRFFSVLFAVCLFLFSGGLLSAQEEDPGEPSGGTRYIIRDFKFDIIGRTRPFALIYNGELQKGELLEGENELERYISHKTQILNNKRMLEKVVIDYTLGEADGEGRIPVDIILYVEDTWNMIAIPYPEYDSNDGFSLTLKARDYNFLGTMSTLSIDFGYQLDSKYTDDFFSNLNRGTINFSIDSNLPFVYWGYDWNFNFDHEFGFTYGEPLYYQNVTGLSMEFPWRWTTFTYGFNQYTIFSIKNTDSDKRRYPGLEDRYDGAYMASELYTAWKIPVGIDIGEYGALNYTPKIAVKVNYGLGKEVDYLRKTPILTLSHVLGFGQVNWVGNYRSGAEASISNSYEFNFYKVRWDNRLSLSGIYHHRFSRLMGFSGRLMYQQWFNDPSNEAGDVLRGVINDELSAKYMFSLNVDFPFRLIRFYPSLWFENSKLRLFNFELHVSPFFDIALVKDPDRNREFSFRKLVYSGGMEVIVFPGIMRSLYLRASIGYRMPVSGDHGKKWDEIFIGLGHFY